jgi:hypothetical protein
VPQRHGGGEAHGVSSISSIKPAEKFHWITATESATMPFETAGCGLLGAGASLHR